MSKLRDGWLDSIQGGFYFNISGYFCKGRIVLCYNTIKCDKSKDGGKR